MIRTAALLSGALVAVASASCSRASSPGPAGNETTRPRVTPTMDVAITVDDLPHFQPDAPGVTPLDVHHQFLAAFAAHRTPPVHGFINASKLDWTPDGRAALDAWIAAGHVLGNHTYTHIDVASATLDAFLADVEKNEPELRARYPAAGDTRWKTFRFPFLREGPTAADVSNVRSALAARGYRIAEVTLYFDDWAYTAPYVRCLAKSDHKAIADLKQLFLDRAAAALKWSDETACALFGRPIKHVLLLHIGVFDGVMISALLDLLEQRGVRFVSLDDALADPVYADEPRAPAVNEGTFLEQVRVARGAALPQYPSVPASLDAMCK
jgi:peptidoglycan/xylan/chitin deacetylase (PgdA/CDA1 family)